MHNPIPLALYIHIPWCIRKCPYCDFNSHANTGKLPEDIYVKALLADLAEDLHLTEKRPISSLFFGGGTPSLFSANSIEKILNGVDKQLPINNHLEITLEANPGTLEHTDFKDYKQAGITRISLGAQSFQDDKLKILGRIHAAKEIYKALESIAHANFASFNIDLMYGLPTQTMSDALYDLNTALSFSPPHLSWYHLTIEPNTVFHKTPPSLPQDELVWDMYEAGQTRLFEAGLLNYEISAFATPTKQCQHNLNYWQFGDYLGIGAGAHSKLTSMQDGDFKVIRHAKRRYPKDYLTENQKFVASSEIVTQQALPFEFMLNALRLMQGFDKSLFQDRTHLDFKMIEKILHDAKNKGLILMDENKIQPTALGTRFLNDLQQMFL